MPKHITLKQAAEYLNVTTMTIYRWIEERKLKAVETKDGMRVKKNSAEIRKKWIRRIKYDGLVCTFPVVTKYRYEPEKYQVKTKDKGAVGWISLRGEYLKGLSKKQLAREYFKPIKYHRVYLEGKYPVIVVSDRDLDRLPRAERAKWKRWQMTPKRIREEISR